MCCKTVGVWKDIISSYENHKHHKRIHTRLCNYFQIIPTDKVSYDGIFYTTASFT